MKFIPSLLCLFAASTSSFAQVFNISAQRSISAGDTFLSDSGTAQWSQGVQYWDSIIGGYAAVNQSSSATALLLDYASGATSDYGPNAVSRYIVDFDLVAYTWFNLSGQGYAGAYPGPSTAISLNSSTGGVFLDLYPISSSCPPYTRSIILPPGHYTYSIFQRTFSCRQYSVSCRASGGLNLTASFLPVNDTCADAFDVSAGGTFPGTLAGATGDGTASCGGSDGNPDVWYRFTAPGGGAVRLMVNACGSYSVFGADTVISIIDGCGGAELACNDDSANGGFISCNPGAPDSSVAATVAPGSTALIRVSNFNAAIAVPFTLNVSYDYANDPCDHNAVIVPGNYNWNNTAATTDGPTEANCSFCCGDLQVNNDLWWGYHAAHDGVAVFDTIGSDFDTKLAAYRDSCPGTPNTAIACNDDGTDIGTLSQMEFRVTANESYLIRSGGYNQSRGNGVLNFHFYCSSDFNRDTVTDFFDYLDFVSAFASNSVSADFNSDTIVDFFDYLDFVEAFSHGC